MRDCQYAEDSVVERYDADALTDFVVVWLLRKWERLGAISVGVKLKAASPGAQSSASSKSTPCAVLQLVRKG